MSNETVKNLEKKINSLEDKIDAIINKLEFVEQDTNKMSRHIDFIGDVYNTVKLPLYWMCDKVNAFRSSALSGIKKETIIDKVSFPP